MINNEYFLFRNNDDERIPIDISEERNENTVHDDYFLGALLEVEKRSNLEGITFYITWRIDKLPSYGQDVVAIVLGDEWCRTPVYADKVRAIFKCYGTRLPSPNWSVKRPKDLNLLTVLQWLRTQVYRAPTEITALANRCIPGRSLAPIYDIPLGYANQKRLPIRPISERSTDIFFSGGFINPEEPWWSPRRWLKTPKHLSRKQMIRHLEKIGRRYERMDLEINLTQGPPSSHDESQYSQNMMNSKICVVPRGSSQETFRFFEALRYGCIVISEPLPSRWFYDGSPAIEIQDWSQLESIVLRVLRNENLLQTKHREGLAWWRAKCSPTAVGKFIADRVDALAA